MELDGKLDRGHGMSSMKHRAKQLHGQCLVESGPGYRHRDKAHAAACATMQQVTASQPASTASALLACTWR
jgi:hypothetical protein